MHGAARFPYARRATHEMLVRGRVRSRARRRLSTTTHLLLGWAVVSAWPRRVASACCRFLLRTRGRTFFSFFYCVTHVVTCARRCLPPGATAPHHSRTPPRDDAATTSAMPPYRAALTPYRRGPRVPRRLRLYATESPPRGQRDCITTSAFVCCRLEFWCTQGVRLRRCNRCERCRVSHELCADDGL